MNLNKLSGYARHDWCFCSLVCKLDNSQWGQPQTRVGGNTYIFTSQKVWLQIWVLSMTPEGSISTLFMLLQVWLQLKSQSMSPKLKQGLMAIPNCLCSTRFCSTLGHTQRDQQDWWQYLLCLCFQQVWLQARAQSAKPTWLMAMPTLIMLPTRVAANRGHSHGDQQNWWHYLPFLCCTGFGCRLGHSQ